MKRDYIETKLKEAEQELKNYEVICPNVFDEHYYDLWSNIIKWEYELEHCKHLG